MQKAHQTSAVGAVEGQEQEEGCQSLPEACGHCGLR